MKGVKGKILKNLKTSMKPIGGYLKQDGVLHFNAADGFIKILQNPILKAHTQFLYKDGESEPQLGNEITPVVRVNDVQELVSIDMEQEVEEEEKMELGDGDDDKENITENVTVKTGLSKCVVLDDSIEVFEEKQEERNCLSQIEPQPLSEIDVSTFRKPDLNSLTLFDPNLLEAFERAVKEHYHQMNNVNRLKQENRSGKQSRTSEEERPPIKSRRVLIPNTPLSEFDEKCPPGGEDSVILYTTTLGGIRKTLEDCNRTRFLLQAFKIVFYERDVSMHNEYKEELWRVIGSKVIPPRLFIKGRYIGGADQILGLHESGKLKLLFDGVPLDTSNGCCEGCGGIRFVVCFHCNGKHRVIDEGECCHCNENGLIICPYCS